MLLHAHYYCILNESLSAIVPVTVMQNNGNINTHTARQAPTDVPFHPKYQGTVLFQNKFKGRLSAAEYPKVNVSAVSPRLVPYT